MDELEYLVTNIERFNLKHDLNTDGQFKQLCEEIGEYAEASNRNESVSRLVEESGDIAFVAISIMLLESESIVEVEDTLRSIVNENLEKNESTDGNKVTKE